MTAPFLSIVIPAYDRAGTIGRCLASLRAQSWTDWEAICVDDGSTDDTRARLAAAAAADPRIHVVAHARNRGVGPARNTGIDRTRADWIVFLDSDDELAGTDALRRMADDARAAPPTLHALWYRARLDDGRLSPPDTHLAHAGTDWDYRGYLAFLQATETVPRDMIRCVRRTCFASVRYPETRMLEEGFHLDFARRFRSRLHPDILRLYHADAPNQLVALVADPARSQDRARNRVQDRDRAAGLAALLRDHAAALAIHAPAPLDRWGRRAVRLALRAGRRRQALASALRLLARRPRRPASWAVLAYAAIASCAPAAFIP